MPPINVNDRAQRILKTLVDLYIREGQPVGSKALVQEAGLSLSPATVRNIMAELEEVGLITQPHTSAGRVPTAQGYRFFVDSLLSVQPLAEDLLAQLRSDLAPGRSPGELVQSASRLLSELTAHAGLATLPNPGLLTLRQVEFVPLSERRVLVVIVFNEREVQNRIMHTDRDYSRDELEQAARYINRHFSGLCLEEARDRLVETLQAERDEFGALMAAAIDVGARALDDPGRDGGDYVMAGQDRLLTGAEPQDMTRLRGLFSAFTEKRDILHLLDRCTRSDGVQLFIGAESGYQVLDDYSVVTAPYESGGRIVGALGVIGPTRMAYERVIPMVDATARLLSLALRDPPP